MTRALLVSLGCVVVSLSIMLGGQYAANIMFPVTSDAPTLPLAPMASTPDNTSVLLYRLYVPFWAPIAHIAACAVSALIGGFLAARLVPSSSWPIWVVSGVLAGWELLAVADIPKSISFSVIAAAICIACAWLGAVASHVLVELSTRN